MIGQRVCRLKPSIFSSKCYDGFLGLMDSSKIELIKSWTSTLFSITVKNKLYLTVIQRLSGATTTPGVILSLHFFLANLGLPRVFSGLNHSIS